MSKQLVGLVGWRGMVGSVLMERMQAEGDFALSCVKTGVKTAVCFRPARRAGSTGTRRTGLDQPVIVVVVMVARTAVPSRGCWTERRMGCVENITACILEETLGTRISTMAISIVEMTKKPR
jgi:hypothetical protein